MKIRSTYKNITLNNYERNILSQVLDNAEKKIFGSTSYKAPWLLSDFDDDVWKTTNRGREIIVGGELKSSIDIPWDIPLPDGSKLTDSKYSALLNASKKIAFWLREGGVDGSLSPNLWRSVINCLKNLICWLVINNKKFKAEKYMFDRISQSDTDSLMYDLACGGWFNALSIPVRIFDAISDRAEGALLLEIDNENVMQLSSKNVDALTEWFEGNGYYKKAYTGVNKNRKYIDRRKIAEIANIDARALSSSKKISAFLRQFEPDFSNSPRIISLIQRHEFPDQNSLPFNHFDSLALSKKDFESIAESLQKIFKISSVINRDAYLDIIAGFSQNSCLKFKGLCKEQGRTKSIPVDIGLSYFNAALGWVECYGDAIVDFYIDSIGSIDICEYEKLSRYFKIKKRSDAFLSIDLKAYRFRYSEIEDISGLIDNHNYSRSSVPYQFDDVRRCPTLEEALRILIGACVICIEICKPSRNDEIVHLNRNCLILKNDGYYIDFSLGKSNHNEFYQEVDKPIPVIAAKAIRLLQRLGESVEKTTKRESSEINKGKLFNLPSYTVGRPRIISSNALYENLDIFCDYVNLPTINGVRWYLRGHEMRKWFLLLLFWGGRNDVLDACRWIAGHTDVRHIYNYIQHEISGEELPKLEAQYAMDRLLDLECRGVCGEDGLSKIYKRILLHFKVEAIALIPAPEWEDYVSEMHQRKEFTIEPQFIYDKTSTTLNSINVSFVLRKV